MEYKIGDRIRITDDYRLPENMQNKLGTISEEENGYFLVLVPSLVKEGDNGNRIVYAGEIAGYDRGCVFGGGA